MSSPLGSGMLHTTPMCRLNVLSTFSRIKLRCFTLSGIYHTGTGFSGRKPKGKPCASTVGLINGAIPTMRREIKWFSALSQQLDVLRSGGFQKK